MKVSTLRATAALTLALALAGCGGKAMFDVAGVISTAGPLTNSGLVLANGSDLLPVPANATEFKFSQRVAYGDNYNVVQQTPPDHMSCQVFNGSGSAGHTSTILVTVQCTQNSYPLSGSVKGLKGTGLVLINGAGATTGQIVPGSDPTIPVGFQLGNVFDGSAFGVTVLTQPANQTCTVENGTGIMHDKPVSNVLVTCTP
ncbi:hypothetical protein [Rugamonas apoptosis]|uniref:Lipoprotein n=1 Tax=Rugamonas apoptosis TaxID=2758570 RepID=A0A7W2FEM4_9BURK|nr:hypothetical protein [Rugamonas apoptosis]MBA5690280.1 hypothetical protein [Rugamonas apoptosis]